MKVTSCQKSRHHELVMQFMNPVEVFVTDSVEQIKTDCFQEHADKNLPDHSEEGGYFG